MGARRKSKKSTRTPRAVRTRLRILFTCVGRRIELIEAFRRSARALRIDLEIYGADINWSAPAIHRVDVARIVPRIRDPQHIPALLSIVRRDKINAVIPLIDSDLLALSSASDRFAELGCTVVISDEAVIRTCADKLLTFDALRAAGIDTPKTWKPADVLAARQHRFPYFLKPRRGSAGQRLYRVGKLEELRVLVARNPDSIVQEFVDGIEHTLDVYTGLDGVPRCVVPRRRLEVRTGEVSKGLIVKDAAIMDVGRRVVHVLGACRGVITVQCMVTPRERIRVIEINPRFGGGAPLSIEAGADFPKWLMAELLGRRLRVDYDGYRDNLAMLRYDQSVFVNGDFVSGPATSAGSAFRAAHRTLHKT